DDARFYEFILDAFVTVGPDRNPLDEIANLHKRRTLFSKLGSVLGNPVTTFGLRLVERRRSPADDIWKEFRVEPSITKPQTEYYVNVVRRDSDKTQVLQAAAQLLGTIDAILETIASEGR
ncbi:MAG: hypothetical protein ACE5KI_05495, partial [Dehalococcoidia bacterium]